MKSQKRGKREKIGGGRVDGREEERRVGGWEEKSGDERTKEGEGQREARVKEWRRWRREVNVRGAVEGIIGGSWARGERGKVVE